MKAYIMMLLQKLASDGKPIGDNEIIQWANEKVFGIPKNYLFKKLFKQKILKKVEIRG
jgi:hypothetical protein